MLQGWRAPDRGALFVVTGPSGVGKSTLIKAARQVVPGLGFSVSATTRAPRPGEKDGVDYHFLEPAEFERRVRDGAFLEHAGVYEKRYGTPREPVEQALASGRSLILDIDVEGHRQVVRSGVDAVSIMLLPPSLQTLRARLEARGTDDAATIDRRMALVRTQLQDVATYDHVLVNDDLDTAHRTFQGVLLAALSRPAQHPSLLRQVQEWLDAP